ncbi:MAG: hypothetical protein A2W37_03305 [Chloroflexi bacterium RBG_16_63_12]|nr:MAG: hypothetical protein A2W37_03305 [Chloroflexi bacterium RBG_16_63_12]
MADADLAPTQQFQDLQPRRVRQHAEHIRFKSIRDLSLFHLFFYIRFVEYSISLPRLLREVKDVIQTK